MTRRQRIRLGVSLHLLEEAILELEKTKKRADALVDQYPEAKVYGGDVAMRAGTYESAVELSTKRLRAIFDDLLEAFPSIERPEGLR